MAAFDVVVIGTGPGGYVSAIRASQLGLSVGVVEDDRPGGVCLNWGCIPTKALLRNAEVVHLFERAETFGVTVQGLQADYAAAVKRSRGVADRMAKGVEFLFKKNKITLFPGTGALKSRTTVEVTSGSDDRREESRLLERGRPKRAKTEIDRHHRRRRRRRGVR
jgi:dihydrolipoamide dehydrogenase